ncbi:MAG: hypothetical protein J6M03_00035 [Clostridia bacterium]|nr:hypothetical protein [Clostridia bacterium]
MCEICRRFICPPACPSYNGRNVEYGRRRGVCASCGKELYSSDEIYGSFTKILCKKCYLAKARLRRASANA